VAVMELLSKAMSATIDRGFLSRNNEELLVSHLLFANNTLIFCHENSNQL